MQCVHGKKKTAHNNNQKNTNYKTNIQLQSNFRRGIEQGSTYMYVCYKCAGLKTNRMHAKRGGGGEEE